MRTSTSPFCSSSEVAALCLYLNGMHLHAYEEEVSDEDQEDYWKHRLRAWALSSLRKNVMKEH
jgi:hypothetical protein